MVQVVLQRTDPPNMKFRLEHAVGLCVCNFMGEGKPVRNADTRRSSPKRGGMSGTMDSPKRGGGMGGTMDSSANWSARSPGSPGGSPTRRDEASCNLTASPVANSNSRKIIVGAKQLVAESKYDSLSEGSLLLTMEAGAEYVVVPSTYSPDILDHFTLSLISSTRVDVTEMNENKSVVLAGKWEEKTSSAGGSHLCDSWDDNPQFQLRGADAAEFQIRLTRRVEQWAKNNKLDPVGSMLGFYIFEGDLPGQTVDLRPGQPRPPTIFNPEFLPVNQVSTTIWLEKAGHPYVIVPCTFAAGKEGPFLLEITCESGFQLERIRKPSHDHEAAGGAEGEEGAGRRDSMAN